MNFLRNLKQIKGDASFRRFYRKKNKKFTSIIVFAKKEKYQNLIVYDAINKILNKNKILAPQLKQENYHKNYIEIDDFGDDTVYKILKKNKSNLFVYCRKAIKVLCKLQCILIKESKLFYNWYAKKKLPRKKINMFKKKFNLIIKKLTLNLKLKDNIFVHRDFHVSNLMLVKNQIGLIDSQDAMIGNKAYDLASFIDDVRFKTSKSLKNRIYEFYISKQMKLDKAKFKNDFEILSILRNLKIIGIFTRLSIRDGKKSYLKLIPYAWNLIEMRINENEIFFELKELLNQNFKKKLNEN